MKDAHMAFDDKARARIDAGQKRLWSLIQEAEQGAAEMCEAGEMELSAGLHKVAAKLREAYAEGRMLKASNGDFIAMSGGK